MGQYTISIRRAALYNVLIQFDISVKIFSLHKMCSNETYSKVHIGINISDAVLIQSGLKEGDALSPLLFNFNLEYTVRRR
jgi:hypothetical protein